MNATRQRIVAICLFLLVSSASLLFCNPAPAQDAAPAKDADATEADLATMELQTLMNVDVTTASLFPEKLSDAPSIMSVVTRDEIRRFGAVTLGEILQRVAGLSVSSQYFTDRSLISARGDQTDTAGGNILFLINGRPTREVMEGGIMSDLIESFPVEILDRIEIIRGPGSVLYGTDAFTAVINLITRKADLNQYTVEGEGGQGSGTLSASQQLLLKRGAFSLVGASQIQTLPDWDIRYIVPPPLRNPPGGVPAEPAFHDTPVIDRGTGDYLGVDYKGLSFMSSFTESQATAFTQGSVGETRETRDFFNLGYDLKFRHYWTMSFNGGYTRTTLNIVPYPATRRDSDEFLTEWTNLIKLSSRDHLTAGLLFDRIAGTELFSETVPATVSAQGSRLSGGVYAELEHQLVKSLKLIGGFQTNKIGNIPMNTVPRVGAIWSPASWVSVKVLYGKAFEAPSLDENLLNRPGIMGNATLLPEEVGTFDLGVTFQNTRFVAGVDYFHSGLSNDIVTIGNAPIHYVNQGSITFNGGELEGKYYLRHDFFVEGNARYQSNVNNLGASNVTPISNYGVSAGVSYESTRGLDVGVFDVFDGPVAAYPVTVNPYEPSHQYLDANFSFDLGRYLPRTDKNRLAVVAHATDLLNRQIWVPGFGFHSIDTVPVQEGRVIYVGLKLSLGQD